MAIVGVTTGGFGTVRGQAHLRQTLTALNALVLAKPEVMMAAARDKFDAAGRLEDELARHGIQTLLDASLAWTRRLRHP